MNYRRNEDGSVTAFRFMKDTSTMIEITASDIDEAKKHLANEIKSYREGYGIVQTKRKFYSPGAENDTAYIWARHDLADKIDAEVEAEEKAST